MPKLPNLTQLKASGDLLFAGLVVAILALLIVPLPTPLLDILLTANIAFAVILLLSALYVRSPLHFSTFPSVLLVATLFRLALNVSSTRLILGDAWAGDVIASFGAFVVRGNTVVGAVIFVILTVIQFLVIAKGSERVAEVSARFSLDAMPGKQMAIDADLRAGAFTLAEARKRRADLQRESQLFGAMDGAMKFVKGDAIAGIIITIINIIGGLVIGIMQHGMSAAEAAQTFTLLTIGDGLVSQIPALVVALAAGLIVTRVGGDNDLDLGSEILQQLGATPKVFGVATVLLVALALVPGLPLVPFLVLAVASATSAWFLRQRDQRRSQEESEATLLTQSSSAKADPLVSAVAPVLVELGAALSARLRGTGSDDAAFRAEMQTVREALFERLGVKLPPIRIRFAVPGIPDDGIRISIYDAPEISGRIPLDRLIARAPADELRNLGLTVEMVPHPLSGAPMSLVDQAAAPQLAEAGIETLGPTDYAMLYLGAATHRRAERFVGLAEVQAALDQLEPSLGALIDAVTPRPVPLAMLTGVLKRLVGEGVSIRDLRAILEALAEDATDEHDVIALTELARVGLSRSIVARIAPRGHLPALMVDHPIEQTIREAIRYEGGKPSLALPPRLTSEILDAFRPHLSTGERPAIVTSQDVRRYIRQLLALEHGPLTVLGLGELHEGVRLEAIDTVRVGNR